MAFWMILICSCGKADDTDYRQKMRDFVMDISQYARVAAPHFIIVPQNGVDLASMNGEHDGSAAIDYLQSIDGVGQEDLRYGYDNDDQATPMDEQGWLLGFLNLVKDQGKSVLVTDYCSTISHVDDSYQQNQAAGFISFAASHWDLDNIPSYPAQPHNSNALALNELSQARNFLYLIDPSLYASTDQFIAALDATNYDCLIIDAFVEDTMLTAAKLNELKTKPNGTRRLVISYLSIGEAEDYRYYWDPSWNSSPPAWLTGENPDWEGNYKVRYWDPAWQAIIFGGPTAYLDRIQSAGFDGAYLDIIDAFEYFE